MNRERDASEASGSDRSHSEHLVWEQSVVIVVATVIALSLLDGHVVVVNRRVRQQALGHLVDAVGRRLGRLGVYVDLEAVRGAEVGQFEAEAFERALGRLGLGV